MGSGAGKGCGGRSGSLGTRRYANRGSKKSPDSVAVVFVSAVVRGVRNALGIAVMNARGISIGVIDLGL